VRQKVVFINVMCILLTLTYILSLVVSTDHLAALYANYGHNVRLTSFGLAVSLEVAAFLLSIASTALGDVIPNGVSLPGHLAILLVWFGNGYEMSISATDQPLWVTVLLSCFVPVGTFAVGKMLGILLKHREQVVSTLHPEQKGALLPTQTGIHQFHGSPITQAHVVHQERNQEVVSADQRKQAQAPQVRSEAGQMPSPPAPGAMTDEAVRVNRDTPPPHTPMRAPDTDPTTGAPSQPSPRGHLPGEPMKGQSPGEFGKRRGNFQMSSLSKPQREMLEHLRHSGPLSVEEISETCSKPVKVVSRTLETLIEKGAIVEDHGIYQAVV